MYLDFDTLSDNVLHLSQISIFASSLFIRYSALVTASNQNKRRYHNVLIRESVLDNVVSSLCSCPVSTRDKGPRALRAVGE